MSEMRHERPGVYSVYDASSVTSAGRAAKRIGVAALAVKGTANTAVTLTGYSAGVEVFGEDGADTPGMSTLLKLLFANGASTVYAVRLDAGGGLEAYQAAFAALANCDVQVVVCDSSGNVGAGTVHVLTACPVAVTAVTNEEAFTGGLSEETDEELRQRILDSFQRLPNGANAAWYELTACRHEGVAAAKAVGKARGAGTVDVYVSAPDGIPSEKLLTELQTVFQKSREIAVNVQVKAPTAATVDVAATVKTAEGTDFANVKTAVEADLAEQFNGKLLGRGVKLAELNSRIYALPGVENCHITAPSADLEANDTVLPVLGTVTVTEEA